MHRYVHGYFDFDVVELFKDMRPFSRQTLPTHDNVLRFMIELMKFAEEREREKKTRMHICDHVSHMN